MPNWTTSSVEPKDSVPMPEKVKISPGKWRPDEAGTLTPGQWAANKETEAHWLAGASAGEKWWPDSRLTEKEYVEAVERAKNHTFGHAPHGKHLKHIPHAIPPEPVTATEPAPEVETKAEAAHATPDRAFVIELPAAEEAPKEKAPKPGSKSKG